jgi:hypothetical protein
MLGQGQARQAPKQNGTGNVCWINTPALHASQCSPGEWWPLGFHYAISSTVFRRSGFKKVHVAVCLQGRRQPAELTRLAFPQPAAAARRFPFGTKLYACKTNSIVRQVVINQTVKEGTKIMMYCSTYQSRANRSNKDQTFFLWLMSVAIFAGPGLKLAKQNDNWLRLINHLHSRMQINITSYKVTSVVSNTQNMTK